MRAVHAVHAHDCNCKSSPFTHYHAVVLLAVSEADRQQNRRPWCTRDVKQHTAFNCFTKYYSIVTNIPLLCIGALLLPPRRLCNHARRLSVFLFVSLLATLCKNYSTDLCENFTTDVSVHKEELIKFWKLSAYGSRNFWKDSSTFLDRAFFHNLDYISRESDRIFMKILLPVYPWTRKFPLNFGSNPDPESGLRI